MQLASLLWKFAFHAGSQCYLPPGGSEILAFTPAKLVLNTCMHCGPKTTFSIHHITALLKIKRFSTKCSQLFYLEQLQYCSTLKDVSLQGEPKSYNTTAILSAVFQVSQFLSLDFFFLCWKRTSAEKRFLWAGCLSSHNHQKRYSTDPKGKLPTSTTLYIHHWTFQGIDAAPFWPSV